MEVSSLNPFVRSNLYILFVGLNPAKGSSHNKHYFSVNQVFWNQLHDAQLVTHRVNKSDADTLIFGSKEYNHKRWEYGITDLVTTIAESDSRKVKPSPKDCEILAHLIQEKTPKVVIIMHFKVCKHFLKFLNYSVSPANSGLLGQLLPNCSTQFFSVAFPHGNAISHKSKVENYVRVREHLEALG